MPTPKSIEEIVCEGHYSLAYKRTFEACFKYLEGYGDKPELRDYHDTEPMIRKFQNDADGGEALSKELQKAKISEDIAKLRDLTKVAENREQ